MKKILAIDDQRDNLISIKGFLKNFLPDCELFLAESGKEGIAIAQKEQPDTILLDIIMPEMDGFEVCKALKQDKRTKFIPILMLSALGQDTESRVKGLELGADAFLAKPFIPTELKAQINVMLRIKEAEDRLRDEKDILEETVLERTYKLKESEEKYKALYDNAPLAYQSLDENGIFIDVNPAWLSTLGYNMKEVIGKNYADFLHPDWRPHFEKNFPAFKKRGYVHDVHFKIRHKKGHYIDIMFEGCIGTHPDGSFKQTYCVFQEITDRLQSEEKLFESEQRYDLAMNASKDGVYDWNLLTNEIYYSPGWKSMLGYKDDELPNDFSIWENLTEAADVKRSWEMQTELINKKRDRFEMEFKMKHKDGHWVEILSRAEAVFDESGKAIRIVGTHIDITESKLTQDALIESERRISTLINNLQGIAYRCKNDKDWTMEFISEGIIEITGYTPEDIIDNKNLSFNDLIIPEDRDRVWKGIQLAVKKKESFEINYRIKTASGEIRYLLEKGNGVFAGETGEFLALEGFVNDITNSKLAEVALQESEQKFKDITERIYDVIMVASLDGNIIFVSPSITRTFGYQTDELIGKNITELVPKYEIPNVIETFKTTKSGINIEEHESQFIRKDGSIAHITLSAQPIVEDDKIIGAQAIVRDITERMKAKDSLKSSEELYKNVFNNSPLGIMHFDVTGVITDCNDEFIRILGSTKEKLVGLNMIKRLKDQRIIKAIKDTIKIGSAYFNDYYTSVTGDRTTPVVIHFRAIYNLKDKIIGGIGMVEDITERKMVEEALLESEELNRSITQSAADAIISMDQDGIVLSWNKAAEKIFDYSSNEMIKNDLSLIIPEKYRSGHNSGIDRLRDGGKEKLIGKTVELEAIRKDGTELPIELSLSSWESDHQKYFTGIIRDITERKQAKDLLSEQRQSLSDIVEGTNAGTWDWNIKTGGLKLNKRWAEIIGYTLEDLEPIDLNTWINSVHPDDLPEANALLEKVFKKELDYYDVVFRQPHKDGGNVWVNARGKIVEWSDDGKPLRMSGTHLNISERKKAEEEQKQSEQRFKRLFDGLGDAVFVTRIGGKDKGRILEVNLAALTQTKYSREELLEMNIINDLSVAGSGEISAEKWEEQLLKGETVTTVEKKKRKDGTEFWTEMIVTRIDFRGEKASLSINHDITNRKRAEQIQKALYNISNAVIVKDNLEKLIKFIQKELGKIIETRNFYVALYDEKSDTLSMPFLADEMEDRTNIPAGKTLTKYVINTQKTLLGTKRKIKELEESGHIGTFGADSEVWLGVPLKIEDKVTGVLAVQSYTDENAYDKSDVEMLEFVSDQISISIGRKKAHDDLLNALKKATESDRLKSAFLATISHELRTPLNAIIGFSDLINGDWPLEEIISFAKTINESGTHLLSIVEEIFDITLIETGETSINNREENLHKILKSVNKTIKSEQRKLNKESLDLNLEIPEADTGIVINTDAPKLKQILLNLLKNALKFTHKGHVKYGYSFIKKDDIKMISFYVKDTGIGVHKDMHNEIFTTFRQVDESLSKNYGGTGIGLSISKKLTELLGGDIWIESVEGQGSTFCFTLPIVESEIDNHQYELGFGDQIAEVLTMEESTTEKTFLIVEDDQTSFEFLEIVFEKPDIKIIWAKDGKEAIEYCKNVPEITLVLMDINMQVMDGYEATRQIKKFRPQLPIIAQTAFAIAGDREKTLEAGCDDYIAKPIVIEELMKKIEKLI